MIIYPFVTSFMKSVYTNKNVLNKLYADVKVQPFSPDWRLQHAVGISIRLSSVCNCVLPESQTSFSVK